MGAGAHEGCGGARGGGSARRAGRATAGRATAGAGGAAMRVKRRYGGREVGPGGRRLGAGRAFFWTDCGAVVDVVPAGYGRTPPDSRLIMRGPRWSTARPAPARAGDLWCKQRFTARSAAPTPRQVAPVRPARPACARRALGGPADRPALLPRHGRSDASYRDTTRRGRTAVAAPNRRSRGASTPPASRTPAASPRRRHLSSSRTALFEHGGCRRACSARSAKGAAFWRNPRTSKLNVCGLRSVRFAACSRKKQPVLPGRSPVCHESALTPGRTGPVHIESVCSSRHWLCCGAAPRVPVGLYTCGWNLLETSSSRYTFRAWTPPHLGGGLAAARRRLGAHSA